MRVIEDGHLKETVGMFIAYYEVIKDFVNPTFFDVDENGELTVTGPPRFRSFPSSISMGFCGFCEERVIQMSRIFLRRIKKRQIWKSKDGKHRVYETEAGQIVGSFKALEKFRNSPQAAGKYKGWDRHHIIEERHLKALGVPKEGHPTRAAFGR